MSQITPNLLIYEYKITVSIPIPNADGLRSPINQNSEDCEFKKTLKMDIFKLIPYVFSPKTCKRTRQDTSITETPPTAPAVLALLKMDVNMKENMMRENPYSIIINKIIKK